MKFYLASRFKNVDMVLAIKAALITAGHTVVSTWHDVEAHPENRAKLVPLDSPEYPRHAQEVSMREIEEIEEADALILYSIGCEQTPGGLWFEMGYAVGLSMRVSVVGPRINVFCYLPAVDAFDSSAEFLASLGAC